MLPTDAINVHVVVEGIANAAPFRYVKAHTHAACTGEMCAAGCEVHDFSVENVPSKTSAASASALSKTTSAAYSCNEYEHVCTSQILAAKVIVKTHATAYGMRTYQSALLLCSHRNAYFTAYQTSKPANNATNDLSILSNVYSHIKQYHIHILMAEATYITAYLKARRTHDTATMRDMLVALPVLLANAPSSAFVATLSMLDLGGLYGDLLHCEPDYHTKAQFALVGTAIDAIIALQPQAVQLAQRLQSQLRQPVVFD